MLPHIRKVSKQNYGVVANLDGRKWIANVDETLRLRENMSNSRKRLPMFDRGEEFRKIKEKGAIKYPKDWTDPDKDWYSS